MLKIFLWLALSLFSGGGLVIYTLQDQYEEHSVAFRILYRDVTVKLSQHETILSLLSVTSDPSVLQQKFPQILAWKPLPHTASTYTLLPAGNGTYWVSAQHFALLIDLKALLAELPQSHYFQHIRLNWQNTPLIELGAADQPTYWQWDKELSSTAQPFELSAGNDPDWARLPWLLLLLSLLFWAGIIYFTSQYRMQKRQRNIAVLREHFSELTRLNAMGEITAGIVHELNQPLTAILGYNQAALRLIDQQQIDKVPPLLDAAVTQIKRISALLQQFRQKLANSQAAFQKVNLGKIWQRVTMLLENEIKRDKVKIINKIPDNFPDFLAEPLWIEQILHNIVTNAIQAQQHKATGDAWVAISAEQSAEGMTIVITDGGPGLSEQALQQVFIPFFTTRPEGLGLGMALTETLVQRLNGNIKAENSAGQGACFTLWFPFNTQEE
ncbi:histidine kinase [Chania multitudinisentens RB-25]|uniref:histidine kinase n=1 Tax=Chania multitudinisentens RB-25 TaxID=1441930 RepID=W0LHB0_9GAMM|nr:ATP-binding protein [Chania multitudinisentens]AHG21687.1 histidine kinase [Chania multitudinisentens RB-25]